MFDLESKLDTWRRSLAATLDPTTLAELESHLRESFARRITSGEPAEQAWGASLNELGDSVELAAEFHKLRPSRLRRPSRIAVAGGIGMAIVLAILFVAKIQASTIGWLLGIHVLSVLVGYLFAYLMTFLMIVAAVVRILRGMSNADLSDYRWAIQRLAGLGLTATTLGVVLGGFWLAREQGVFFNADPRELGGIAVIAWYVLVAWRIGVRQPSERTALVLAGLGQFIVTLAWFVASMMASDRPSQQTAWIIGLSAAGIEVFLIGLTVVPTGLAMTTRRAP